MMQEKSGNVQDAFYKSEYFPMLAKGFSDADGRGPAPIRTERVAMILRLAPFRTDVRAGGRSQTFWRASHCHWKEASAMVWKRALLSGTAFGLLFGAAFSFMQGWLPPHAGGDILAFLIIALLSGALFGGFIGLFAGSRTVARQTAIDLPPGEIVEYAGPANHFRNGEARGGKLYLTNRRLIFQPHHFNLQNAPVGIARSEIAGAAKSKTLGIIPNGLLVRQSNGETQRFVVSDRSAWLRRIMERPGPVS
jgi:hypothetical protein